MAFHWRNKNLSGSINKSQRFGATCGWLNDDISFLDELYLHPIQRFAISGAYVFSICYEVLLPSLSICFLLVLLVQGVPPIRFHICIWKINKSLMTTSLPSGTIVMSEIVRPYSLAKGVCGFATHACSWWVCLSRSGVHKMCCIKIDTVLISAFTLYTEGSVVNSAENMNGLCHLTHLPKNA